MTWQRALLHVMIFPDMSDCFLTSNESSPKGFETVLFDRKIDAAAKQN